MSLTIITPEESQKAHARLADEIHAALTAIDPKTVYALCAANKLTGGALVLSRRIHTGFHSAPPCYNLDIYRAGLYVVRRVCC